MEFNGDIEEIQKKVLADFKARTPLIAKEQKDLLDLLEKSSFDKNNHLRKIHSLKTSFNLVGLVKEALLAHQIEELLEKYTKKDKKTLISIVNKQKEIVKILTNLSKHIKHRYNFKKELEKIITLFEEKNNLEINLETEKFLKINSLPEKLLEVFQILIINSIEHAFTKKQKNKTNIINIEFSRAKKFIKIVFQDNGKGINLAKGNLKKINHLIFAPGFTTKKDVDINSGRGFGLYFVKKLLQEMNSEITYSKSKTGAKFIIKLINF